MSVRIGPGSIVVRKPQAPLVESPSVRPVAVSDDGALLAAWFDSETVRRGWLSLLQERGVMPDQIIPFDAAGEPVAACEWLAVERRSEEELEGWLSTGERGALAELVALDSPPYERHEMLARSESGLHYVRERSTGILRRLTDDELRDFSDPPPCTRCGEQFGCEHRNCANEPLLGEAEIRAEVPPEWMRFARECGISRNDIARLQAIERVEDEYRLRPDRRGDMRTMELILILNGDE